MSGFHRIHSHRSLWPGSPITASDLPQALFPNKSTLEIKLELLERRFTMPSNTSPNTKTSGSPSESATLGSPGSQQVHINSGSRQHVGFLSRRTHDNNSNPSQHAFSFDNPSLSYQSSCHASSRHGNSQSQPFLGSYNEVRTQTSRHDSFDESSKRDESSNLEAVVAATTKHMSKVAAQNHINDFFSSQNSNPTVLTSHIQKKAISTIVQETPPETNSLQPNEPNLDLHVEAGDENTEVRKTGFPCSLNRTEILTTTNTYLMTKDKRKSFPVKREIHSVRESTEDIQQPDIVCSDILTNTSSDPDRKRKRLVFDHPTSSEQTAMTNVDSLGNENVNKSPNTINGISPPNQRKEREISPLRSRLIGNNGNNSSYSPTLLSRSENSRDNSKSAKSSTRVAKNTAPVNNTTIYDFFPAAVSKKNAEVSVRSDNEGSAATSIKKSLLISPKKKTKTRVSIDAVEAPLEVSEISKQLKQQLEEVEQMKQRCRELEQLCEDKEEQLKAVANNRTILHSALKSALLQRDEELSQLVKDKERYESATRNVLEKLVRQDACQQARELREKLAVDGARLGRIVYTRAGGMIGRSAHLESWEDGHATKELQSKKSELALKRKILELRQDAALREFERLHRENINTSNNDDRQRNSSSNIEDDGGTLPSTRVGENEGEKIGGMYILTALDAREAIESARLHLSNLKRQEHELAIEEQALNDEKGNHIRALKRVASEDASRFRSRPKLHDRYVLQELLGKGGFSEVWRAYDLVELREVAVKIHQLDPRWPESKKENYTKHVSREYEIHRNVRHPRIVSLFDVFEIDNNSFATVLECCNGTDLDTLLKARRRLPERDARAILLQIISGMQYLSRPSPDGKRQGIIHYDLKPGNILFDEYGDAKITDFGLSKIVDTPDSTESMELTSQGAGTYWYLPPECFVTTDSVRISNKVDVWSIGVIFYQMLFGKRPFGDGQSQDKIMSDRTMLNAHEVTFPDKPDTTKECKQFIRACLTYDQSFRPNIAQIAEHVYVISKEL